MLNMLNKIVRCRPTGLSFTMKDYTEVTDLPQSTIVPS